jgi:deazaflavin-dependent oxidoreductase (nitroreductase family)
MDDKDTNDTARSGAVGPDTAAGQSDAQVSGTGEVEGTRPTNEPRARTMALQGVANRIVRGLLRTPLLCRVLGNRLITVYAVGRKSGRRYTVPVAYTRDDGALLIGTPFGWGRNLRTGVPVDIRLKGQRRAADVEVATDRAGVVAMYAEMARDNHQFAKFNNIVVDQAGEPNPTDLHLAWAAGARAIRLTPR